MTLNNSIVRLSAVAAALAGFAGMPSVADASDEIFFVYGCGVDLCSPVEAIPASGITRQRFILSDRYVSDASITLTVAEGKTRIVMNWVKIPLSGAAYERHHSFEITNDGPSTLWLNTDTDGEYDFFVAKGREALVDAPYPRGPVEHVGSPIIVTSHCEAAGKILAC